MYQLLTYILCGGETLLLKPADSSSESESSDMSSPLGKSGRVTILVFRGWELQVLDEDDPLFPGSKLSSSGISSTWRENLIFLVESLCTSAFLFMEFICGKGFVNSNIFFQFGCCCETCCLMLALSRPPAVHRGQQKMATLERLKLKYCNHLSV